MFKKILHYTFKTPHRAFDISAFHQHGDPVGVGFSEAGAAPGSGAMLFNGTNSRVRVPYGEMWHWLDAIKVEALFKIEALGTRHNLVEGLLSFALFVRGDGTVTGSLLAPKEHGGPGHLGSNTLVGTVLGGGGSPDPFDTEAAAPPGTEEPEVELAWKAVSSDGTFAPDGVKRTISPGTWTWVTFIHNGFSMQLWIGDVLAGYRDDVEFGVLGVQPGGVHVGAWPNANEYVLNGALDELRIWKLDPFFRQERFFCRTMSPDEEACWRILFHHIMRQWRDPVAGPKVDKILHCIHEAEHDLLRAVHSQGAQAISQGAAFGQRYDRLWCGGQIDGAEMAEFMKEFSDWLQNLTGSAYDDFIAKLIGCRGHFQALGLDDELRRLAYCDARWQAFGRLIAQNALGGLCSPPVRPESPDSAEPGSYRPYRPVY